MTEETKLIEAVEVLRHLRRDSAARYRLPDTFCQDTVEERKVSQRLKRLLFEHDVSLLVTVSWGESTGPPLSAGRTNSSPERSPGASSTVAS